MSYGYYGAPEQPKPRRGCGLGCGFWIALFIILLVGVAGYGYYAYLSFQRAYPHLQAGYNLINTETTTLGDKLNNPQALQTQDFDQVTQNFDKANVEFEAAKNELRYVTPVLPYLGWVPTYGPDLAAAPHMLTMATSLTAAATLIGEGGKKMATEAASTSPLKTIIVAGATDFSAALTELDKAQAEYNQIDVNNIHTPELRAALDQYNKTVPPFRAELNKMISQGGSGD